MLREAGGPAGPGGPRSGWGQGLSQGPALATADSRPACAPPCTGACAVQTVGQTRVTAVQCYPTFCQPCGSSQSRRCGACRYSPEASESEEDPDELSLQRPARIAHTARPDQGGSSLIGQDRNANGAGPRVLLRWTGRPESLGSQPPLQDMLRSRPRSARQADSAGEGAGGDAAAGLRALRPRGQAAGLSPDHSLRRSQRSMRSAASPSPAPEDASRHLAHANGSAAAFTPAPSQDSRSAAATGMERSNGFAASPCRTRRARLRQPSQIAAQSLGRSVVKIEDSEALMDEQEQFEEAIRQSLLHTEEKHQADAIDASAAPSSTAQKGRSGLRIKLRGTS